MGCLTKTDLTKQNLIDWGITDVDIHGHYIMRGDKKLHFSTSKAGYKVVSLNSKSYGVHRIVYVWYYEKQPAGFVIDHVDNNKQNNELYNLQLLTPEENLAKQRPKPKPYAKLGYKKVYTEDYIKAMIAKHEARLAIAKEKHDAEECHKIRCSVAQWKNRLKQVLWEI